jgi:ribosome assembly protein YihI (activator of Der GTPase)
MYSPVLCYQKVEIWRELQLQHEQHDNSKMTWQTSESEIMKEKKIKKEEKKVGKMEGARQMKSEKLGKTHSRRKHPPRIGIKCTHSFNFR